MPRKGVAIASMIAPSIHLYTKDDETPLVGSMTMTPFHEEFFRCFHIICYETNSQNIRKDR